MGVELHRDMMANENISIGSDLHGKLKTFKYLGSLSTNQNSIHEEIKFRLKRGNSCYYSVRTLSSRLLCKNLEIKIHKTIALSVILHDGETWYLTLREECRLRGFENWILSRIFGTKRDANERNFMFIPFTIYSQGDCLEY